jgi:hypothetical protein
VTPKTPPELDAIADVVLNYKPKPKTKAQRKRAIKAKKNYFNPHRPTETHIRQGTPDGVTPQADSEL